MWRGRPGAAELWQLGSSAGVPQALPLFRPGTLCQWPAVCLLPPGALGEDPEAGQAAACAGARLGKALCGALGASAGPCEGARGAEAHRKLFEEASGALEAGFEDEAQGIFEMLEDRSWKQLVESGRKKLKAHSPCWPSCLSGKSETSRRS